MTGLKRYSHYIGGADVVPTGGEWLEASNPFIIK